MFNEIDYSHMSRALELAEKGAGLNHPNPLVGAVVAVGDRVTGQGYHLFENVEHAERIAINEAAALAKGATLYVNLEPCVHQGRALPCGDLIIQSGIKRVVFAINDPDPRVSGKGEQFLIEAGVKVEKGLMSERASELNRDYLKVKSTGLPWILVKVATSLDGKIGLKGVSRILFSCPESLKLVHRLRAWCDAIMVGANTIRIDNPQLTCRLHEFESVKLIENDDLIYPRPASHRNPVRIIISRNLDISMSSGIFDISDARTIVFCDCNANNEKIIKLKAMDVSIELVDSSDDGLNLEMVLRRLAEMGIMSVMVEGGGSLIGSLMSKGFVDEIYISVTPIIIGEASSVGWISKNLTENFHEMSGFKINGVFKIGTDCIIRARKKE